MLGPGAISKGLGDLLEGRPYQPYAVVGDYVTDIRPDRDVLRAVGGDVKQGGHAIKRRLVNLEGKEGKEFVGLANC